MLLAPLTRALDKNIGLGGCHVCDEGFVCDVGEYTRLGIWFRSRRHQWILRNRRTHRATWARHHWNPYRLPGYPKGNLIAAERRPRPALIRRIW